MTLPTTFLPITTAIRDTLKGGLLLTDGPVVRGRRLVLEKRFKAGIAVNSIRHVAQVLSIDGQDFQWETTVVVAVYVRAMQDEDAEEALDPYIAAVWGRLAGMTPPAGATSVTLDPAIGIDLDEADQTVAVASLQLRVTHITTGGVLAA